MKDLVHQLTLAVWMAGFTGAALGQGDLTPPGDPAPTMKTLVQVEPRTDVSTLPGGSGFNHVISQPGSYYLSENIAVTTTSGGTGALLIESADVTVDLNGFVISFISGEDLSSGVRINGATENVTIRNGAITGFRIGISGALTPAPKGCLFKELAVSGCPGGGIRAGTAARIVDCRAHNNGTGIFCEAGSVVSGCVTEGNSSWGIFVEDDSVIVDCVANGNGTDGIYGRRSCSVTGCVANDNTARGIWTGQGSTVSRCTVRGNQGDYGIKALMNSSVSACTASEHGNGAGISVTTRCSVSGCTATLSMNAGIEAGDSSSVTDCQSSDNGSGLVAGNNCLVDSCSAVSNDGPGIVVGNDSSVVSSAASANTDTGISCGDGTLVNGCTSQGNEGDFGIEAGAGCSIIASNAFNNTGSGITSYGIYGQNGCLVERCVARGNRHTNTTDSTAQQGGGIRAGKHSTVRGCSATLNQGDGIRITENCLAQDNMCQQNGINGDGAGVHATTTDNVIDGNTVVYCVRGIDVDSVSNLIVRNRVRSCTEANYSIVAANRDAQVLTPGSAFSSTDPWANFNF